MRKRIFIIGQCTLHWGRMEFGNIGNFYIIKPLFEELRRIFPEVEIATTMQLSEQFCKKFLIETVPMEFYYDFNSDNNLAASIYEYEQVLNNIEISTPYIEQVKKADLIIDFSGDIWGDNADFLGLDRFATGCYKDLTAQLLRPTVMIAGSPGPFSNDKNRELARKTYAGFAFVSNREPVSTKLLRSYGFDLRNTFNYPCPSFLFTKADDNEMEDIFQKYNMNQEDKNLKIGFVLCGWNFKRGPYSIWPREDKEYDHFVDVIRHLMDKYDAHMYLLSHSNGFNIPPSPFALKHGRDFPIMKQLYEILKKGGVREESNTY